MRRAAIFVFVVALWLIVQFLPPPAPPQFQSDVTFRRAAWLGVTWSMDAHDDAALQALADDFSMHHITDVYVYVTYLKADDTFNPTYDYARDFTQQFRERAPTIRLFAWVGVPIQVTRDDGERIDNRLQDEPTRRIIAEFARQTITDMGFDGVHLNAELIPDGDAAYLATLDTIHENLPSDALLSVAPHALRIDRPVTVVPYPLLMHHMSPAYLHEIAQRVDQVAVMLYDSGLFLPTDYRSWVAYQVRALNDALSEPPAEIFVGLPVSEERTPSHQLPAESLANALHGLRVGMQRDVTVIDGLALYPHWELSPEEWILVDQLP